MFQKILNRWSLMVHDKKWWKSLLTFISDIRLYPGGIVLFGASSYKIKGPHMRAILEVLKPGDVLLRRYAHYFGSLMVPGFWSHAAVYVGDNKVIHMLGAGITEEDILTFMRCDAIKILRFNDPSKVEPAIQKAKEYLSKGGDYDFGFIQGDEDLYCSELVFMIYDCPEAIKYKNYILPDDLECPCFDIIWEKR